MNPHEVRLTFAEIEKLKVEGEVTVKCGNAPKYCAVRIKVVPESVSK
jgi:hypothetical protein